MSDLIRFDQLCHYLNTDDDLEHGTRELALAIAWVQLRDPARHNPTTPALQRLDRLLGSEHGQPRSIKLFAADAPRYHEPYDLWYGGCTHDQCGADAEYRLAEKDLVTGHTTYVHRLCPGHTHLAPALRQQVAQRGTPPPPCPNVGGRLPRYFDRTLLTNMYAACCPGWTPPAAGLCVDDWPRSGQAAVVNARSRLRLVRGDTDG